ncbi:hypothetical protein H072_7664 [Dactylellina haptotyla CBS 200.50]|uniref:Ion transport domain-containing protein n=1 Tax=Dactylellina haptotyla (strain CBS 200.50) TaxID=1284197 RepID=S8ABN5_DACHA|nr:hypothetical protein H072_7664 [Dactylellina haptotyla CBS 200.50]
MESDPLIAETGMGRFRHYHIEHEEPLPVSSAGLAPFNNENLPVYYTIHRSVRACSVVVIAGERVLISCVVGATCRIRNEVMQLIDDPYSLKQLRDPRMNTSVVRPLVDKYYEMKDASIVFCLLVNRMQFQSEQSQQSHEQSVNLTRAILCELVATRILRRFHEDNPGPDGLLLLANILVAGFSPFQGAPDEVQQENLPKEHWAASYKTRHPALEIAIVSQSKLFLSSAACQLVVNAIYIGRITYTPTTFIDIIPDHYKYRPIALYDPRKAPLLNQYRLMVPRTRNIIEVCEFICLLGLYVWVMIHRPPARKYPVSELIFAFYSCGWILEQLATILEHGWFVYTQNLWSFLDVTFSLIFGIYGVLRLHGVRTDSPVPGQQALDVLAVGATILIPRLAFNLMSENMLFVSLRAMVTDFTVLTVLAAWCFIGFLLSMLWLAEGKHSVVTIGKWMLWVWFGLDGTGIGRAHEFHWILGPVLMVSYAFLGYLFLVILVSMLSTTFSSLQSDVTAEIQFRRAVLTLEGVKSDAIFSYYPPLNLFAIAVLLPLKFMITDRWFHKINVAIIRTLNLPVLLMLAVLERRAWWAPKPLMKQAMKGRVKKVRPSMGKRTLSVPVLSKGFSAHGDIQAVFKAESERIIQEEMEVEAAEAPDVGADDGESFAMGAPGRSSVKTTGSVTGERSLVGGLRKLSRRDSMMPLGEMADQLRAILSTADDESEAGGNIGQRIHVLEDRLKNIEEMLETLVGGRKSRRKIEEDEVEEAGEE